MNDATTTEKRLRLVRQIRTRYSTDQFDLSNRERILYGKSTRPAQPLPPQEEEGGLRQAAPSAFSLRLLAAALLLAAVVAMDKKGFQAAGITVEHIFQAISADYVEQLETWVSQPSRQSL